MAETYEEKINRARATLRIERNVEIPDFRKKYYVVGHLPLADLEVGDSVVVELPEEDMDRGSHSIRVRCSRYGKQHGVKFSVGKEKENNVIRIWRIE